MRSTWCLTCAMVDMSVLLITANTPFSISGHRENWMTLPAGLYVESRLGSSVLLVLRVLLEPHRPCGSRVQSQRHTVVTVALEPSVRAPGGAHLPGVQNGPRRPAAADTNRPGLPHQSLAWS